MTAEYDTKSVLLELMKDGENKTCADCDVPMPQWASLDFGTFVCLNCSGIHRSLGVHITFVRSLTMDRWTEAQVAKMKEGGNANCRQFFESSPEYRKDMSIGEKYSSHFASQYKEKLVATIAGTPWTPSPAPPPPLSTNSSSSSLRKPRASGLRSASPISPGTAGGISNPYNQSAKTPNENYFASLGSANEGRRADLPPSQGGRYGGFGSEGSSMGGSEATSSRALPSFDDLRDDPVSALGRGWGFLGAALGQASRSINENVVQPGLARAADPALQSQFSGYLNTASAALSDASRKGGEVLAQGLQHGGETLRRDFGVDVGDLGASYVERSTGRGAGGGYGQVGTFDAPSAENVEEGSGGGDFFGELMGSQGRTMGGYRDQGAAPPAVAAPPPRVNGAATRAAKPVNKKDDDWDDWKD